MEWIVYLSSAFVLCVVSTFLVIHCDYEDGFIGRVSLAMMAVSQFLMLIGVDVGGTEYEVLPHHFIFQVGAALFMARHAYRFIYWRRKGRFTWTATK